jgi:E3 ubiquitin-protein ligase synoviolin
MSSFVSLTYMLVFRLSQYAILMASAFNTIVKYVLSLYDLRRAGRMGGENAPPWENKSMWFFYIELATGIQHLLSSWVGN